MPIPDDYHKPKHDFLTDRYIFLGRPGCGKTTLAKNFDTGSKEVLFFAAEDGIKKQRKVFAWKTDSGNLPDRWEHWVQCVRELADDDTGIKMVAVDTIDILIKWCVFYIRKREGITHESETGGGKAWQFVKEEFFKTFNFLQQNGYGYIMISHSLPKTIRRGGLEYENEDLSVSASWRPTLNGLVDYAFFFKEDDETDKMCIHTKPSKYHFAKDRTGLLPEKIIIGAETDYILAMDISLAQKTTLKEQLIRESYGELFDILKEPTFEDDEFDI